MYLAYRSTPRIVSICLSLACVVLSTWHPAQAAGPVERMAQVIIDPANPMHVVVRYGAASEGLLFSTDGGRTFSAMCSAAIDAELGKLSRQGALYDAILSMDGDGQLLFANLSAVWYGDAIGCAWTKQEQLSGKWISDLELDPSDRAQMLALAITSTGEGDESEARSELMRRSADGAWSVVGSMKKHAARQRAYVAGLVAARVGEEVGLYAALTSSTGPLSSAAEITTVVFSEDGGRTWVEQKALPAEQDRLKLIAVDPLNINRVLAVVSATDAPDTLLLSDDRGMTFRLYAEIQEFSGIAFDPAGRVFIADAGDGSAANGDAAGGAWTAAKLGDTLSRLPHASSTSAAGLDCIAFDPQSGKLKVCKTSRFGLLDPESGVFEELTRLDVINSLVQCATRDLKAICEPQLNAGPSWCCTGHYPFTPFCGDYDVTRVDDRRVFCGLSGRAQDEANGNGPAKADGSARDGGAQNPVTATPAVNDASVSDAGHDADSAQTPPRAASSGSSDGGCATAGAKTTLSTYVLLALASLLGRRRSRSETGTRDKQVVKKGGRCDVS